jgi:tetratricopeptide (TPR) repeat protein/SAM-dependent methyltransferase
MISLEATLESAIESYQSGDLDRAQEICLGIMQRKADHATALFLSGVIAYDRGENDTACRLFHESVEADPGDPAAHNMLGTAYLERGEFAPARASFERALDLDADFVEAQSNLAGVLMRLGDFAKACAGYRRALLVRPDDADARLNLGVVLRELGEVDEAMACFKEALRLRPDFAEAHNNVGLVLMARGDLRRAAQAYARAIDVKPDLAEAHNNLGDISRLKGRIDEALESYRRAASLRPAFARALFNMGCCLLQLGEIEQAATCYLESLDSDPSDHLCRLSFVDCLNCLPDYPLSEPLRREVERCFESRGIDKQKLVGTAVRLIKREQGFGRVLEASGEGLGGKFDSEFRRGAFREALDSSLLRRLLEETVLTDLQIEGLLTKLRRSILDCTPAPLSAACNLVSLQFVSSLAKQCFNNEYIFARRSDEEERIGQLRAVIQKALASGAGLSDDLHLQLTVFGMYEPLHRLNGWRRLADVDRAAWPAPLLPLVKCHLWDHQTELDLRRVIEPLGRMNDPASRSVRAQYEENPYPRWLSTMRHVPQTVASLAGSLFSQFSPPEFLSGPARVLVAGCGTGKHAIDVATRFKDAAVLGVDISLSSLAYAARMAQELNVDNVTFRQGDVLRLPDAVGEFEVIECVGVLQHLQEAEVGCAKLVRVLRQGGLLKLGLYSEKARVYVKAARALAGLPARVLPETIRNFRERIKGRGPDDPIAQAMVGYADFYSLSDCRDLIFPAHEHCFTLPRLGRMLQDAGLRPVGFEFSNPLTACLYRKCFPDDVEMTNLANWEQIEAALPHTFVGMYQFWCQKL